MIKKVLLTLLVLVLLGILTIGSVVGVQQYVIKVHDPLYIGMRFEEAERDLRFMKATEVTRFDISQNYLGGRYDEDLDAMDERIVVYSLLMFSFIVIYDEEDKIYLIISSGI